MSEVIMGKAHPNNLQYPIDLGDSSDVGDILGQLPKQSVDFKFGNTKSGSIDKWNNHPLEIHSYCKKYQSTDTSHFF